MRQASCALVIGSQVAPIPGQAPFAPSDEQPQRLLPMIGVTHGQRQDAGPHPQRAAAGPHRALGPASLATGEFPGRWPLALRVQQMLRFFPAQHKAQREGEEQAQPETAGEALIKGMQYPSSPLNRHLEQEFALLIASDRTRAGRDWSPTA